MAKPSRDRALAQPHDRFFKWVFSQRRHAVGLLKAALPPALVAAVDFSTLRIEKGSFVDEALRKRHSDLLLSAQVAGRPVYFYVLLEQQRDVEPLMVFRVGLYMMRVWDHLVRDHPQLKELPGIMPIVIYNGVTGWTAATAFQDIVAVDPAVRTVLLPHIPHFELRLIDLSPGRATQLAKQALTALGQLAMWCLSVAGDDKRMRREIRHIAAAIVEVRRAPNGLAALEVVLRYLAATHERLSVKKLSKLFLEDVDAQAQEGIVNVLDQIERRGEREGKRKGRAQTLLEQMAARFGEVPADVAARVEAAGEAALSRWSLRVLTAPSLNDVLDDAPPARSRSTSRPRRRT